MSITRRERDEAQAAGYVECSECGHPIEKHDTHGCPWSFDDYRCPCTEKLTIIEINVIRKDYGLPGLRWRP
jgi:hypothetical protein